MRALEIHGADHQPPKRTHEGSRAVVLFSGKLLLGHEINTGWWLLPGGRREPGEDPAACCAREVLEETGLLVRPETEFLTLREYYGDRVYLSHCFVCALLGQGAQRLTEAEARRGLVPCWLGIEAALARFRDASIADAEQRRAYLRDGTILAAWLDGRIG